MSTLGYTIDQPLRDALWEKCPEQYAKRIAPYLISEANAGKNYDYCARELLKCIEHNSDASLSILAGIRCHHMGFLRELESKLQDEHAADYAQKMQAYLITEANAGRDQKYCASRLANAIAHDPSKALPILNAISPYQIGFEGLTVLREKLWELKPAEYARKMLPVLIEKANAGKSHAYCAAWFAHFIERNQKSALQILDGIQANQLNSSAFDQLREILSETCEIRYGGKMAVHYIQEINAGRAVQRHSVALANLIEEGRYDGLLALNEVSVDKLGPENRLRITLQGKNSAEFALREAFTTEIRPGKRWPAFQPMKYEHA